MLLTQYRDLQMPTNAVIIQSWVCRDLFIAFTAPKCCEVAKTTEFFVRFLTTIIIPNKLIWNRKYFCVPQGLSQTQEWTIKEFSTFCDKLLSFHFRLYSSQELANSTPMDGAIDAYLSVPVSILYNFWKYLYTKSVQWFLNRNMVGKVAEVISQSKSPSKNFMK